MTQKYIKRSLEPVLIRAVGEFPAIVLTGPRQSGKTTLLKHLFQKEYKYVSLELPDVRGAARSDPRGFLEMYQPPVIFDEVQYAADLLPYIKEIIDADRDKSGQYLLTGSQNLMLLSRVTESLAGRAAIMRLLPLSNREAIGSPLKPFPWESERTGQSAESTISDSQKKNKQKLQYRELWKSFLRGGYPELTANPDRDINLWHASYVQTYLERDVRSLRQIGDLGQFQNFLRALAARSGQLFKMTEIARDLGIAVNTVKAWLSILEATHQITILRPYFANIGKRLVKMPKIYFNDVGTLCYLAGLRNPEHAAAGPMGGPIFETAVLSEIRKTIIHRGENPLVHFWRTSDGNEIDIILETEGKLIPIEITTNATPNPAKAKRIIKLQSELGDRVAPGYVIHPGETRLPLGSGVTALPFSEL